MLPANHVWAGFECGDDSWALPKVKEWASTLVNFHFVTDNTNGIVYNDFSNMNAGFFPPHVSHNLGIDVDVEFGTIHNNRNFAVSRTAAKKLIELLNSSVGEHIDYIYVMFPTTQDNDFWNEIRNAVLDDDSRVVPENLANTVNPQDPGVHAQGRIRWSPGHEGHFHIRWKRQ